MIDGFFSLAQYIRSIKTNFPEGTGSQLDSLAARRVLLDIEVHRPVWIGLETLSCADAHHPRLFAEIDPGGGVERVGVGRRHIAERRVRILARLDELAH